MACQRCESERVAKITAKCSDCFATDLGDTNYVPQDMGIGGGDYVEFSYCLDCGQIQGKWPLPLTELEQSKKEQTDCFVCPYCGFGDDTPTNRCVSCGKWICGQRELGRG